MKFRKLKLAALLATAVLTAGTMSLATYAADDEVVIDNDGGQNETMPVLTSEIDGATPVVAAETNNSALRYVEGSIKFSYTGKIDPATGKPTEKDKMSATYWEISEELLAEFNSKTAEEKKEIIEKLDPENPQDGWYFKKAENVQFYGIGEVDGKADPALCSDIDEEGNNAGGYIVLSADVYNGLEKVSKLSENIYVEAQHDKDTKWIAVEEADDHEPTCDEDGQGTLHWKCKVCGKEGKDARGTIAALGHNWQDVTILNDGTKYVNDTKVTVALVVEEGHDGKPDVTEDRTDYNENLKVDANNHVVLGSDGIPELADPTKDGWYVEVIYCANECDDDNCCDKGVGGHRKVKMFKGHQILAKEAKVAVITEVKGVVNDVTISATDIKDVKDKYDMLYTIAPMDGSPAYTEAELQKFEMVDCSSKAGSYTVTYFNGDSAPKDDNGDGKIDAGEIGSAKPIGYQEFEIPAHHMLEPKLQVEFASLADMRQCNVSYNGTTNTWTVTNKSCVLPVNYYLVEHCAAAGCNITRHCNDTGRVVWDSNYSKVNKHEYSGYDTPIAAPFGGNHNIDKEAREYIQKYVSSPLEWNAVYDEANVWNALYEPWMKGHTLEDYLNGVKATNETNANFNGTKHPSVKLVKVSDDCEEGGKVRIEYHCTLCDALITSTEFTVNKGHFDLPSKMVEIQKSTCVEKGVGKVVTPCARSGEHYAKVERYVDLPLAPHTNQLDNKLADGSYVDDIFNKNGEKVNLEVLGYIVIDYDGMLLNGSKYMGSIDIVENPDGTTNTKVEYGYLDAIVVDTLLGLAPSDWPLLTVDGRAVTNCEYCKNHEVSVATAYLPQNWTKAEIDSEASPIEIVSKGGSTQSTTFPCMPGTITLEFKYQTGTNAKGEPVYASLGEETFPYYSSRDTYAARGDHKYGPEYRVTVEEATETTEGKVEVRRKCEICGTEDTIKIETIPAKGPAPVEPTKLPAVQNVNAEVVGNGEVKVTWNAVEGADGYFITAYNKISQGATVKKITSGTVTEWTDTNAKTDDYSVYWVTAYKNEADGSVTKGELIMDDGYDWAIAIQLSKVSGLQANGVKGGITLSWNAVKGANSYMLLAKDGGKGDYVVQQMVYATTYMDTTATVDSVRSYWVIPAYERTNGKRLAVGPTSDYVADRALAK